MKTVLYAQPYDISATGFYFESADDYATKVVSCRNSFGAPVEEFEIQFMDGEAIDAALARAVHLSQANLTSFFDCVEAWEDWEKTLVIIAVGECGYDFDPDVSPDHYGIDVYFVASLRELAEQLVEEGILGDIPETLRFYFDYDAFARDLAVEYTATEIAGEHLVYRAS
ncbi:MAG: antirestriction protein ArdA [Pseudomonadota bacterium]